MKKLLLSSKWISSRNVARWETSNKITATRPLKWNRATHKHRFAKIGKNGYGNPRNFGFPVQVKRSKAVSKKFFKTGSKVSDEKGKLFMMNLVLVVRKVNECDRCLLIMMFISIIFESCLTYTLQICLEFNNLWHRCFDQLLEYSKPDSLQQL